MREFTYDDLVAIIEGISTFDDLMTCQHELIGSYFRRHMFVNTGYDEMLRNSDATAESTKDLASYLVDSQSTAASHLLIETINFIGYHGQAMIDDFRVLDEQNLLAYYVLNIQCDTMRLGFENKPLSADIAMELSLRYSDRHADITDRLDALAMFAAMHAVDVGPHRYDLSVLTAMAMKVIAFAHD